MMHRQKFVGTLAGGLAMSRSMAEAQPVAKIYRVGFLLGATGESVLSLFLALKEGLHELGYVEGRNIAFVQRYADGKVERLPDLAAELVGLNVDVIVTGTNLHVAAVQHATATIPIVMVFAATATLRAQQMTGAAGRGQVPSYVLANGPQEGKSSQHSSLPCCPGII